MPIVHQSYADPVTVAGARAMAAQAIAAEEQRRQMLQESESTRRFDAENEYRLQQSALDNQFRRSQLGQQAYQFNVNAGLQAQQQFAGQDLAWAGLDADQAKIALGYDQMAAQQQAVATQANTAMERERMRILADQQRQAEEERLKSAVRAQDAIQKFPFSNPQQYQSAVQQWEKRFSMPWDLPQRAVAEQQLQQGETRRTAYVSGLAKLTGLDEETIGGLVIDGEAGPQLTVPPQLVTGIAETRMSDQRQRDLKTQELNAQREVAERTAAATAAKDSRTQRQKSIEGERDYKSALATYHKELADYQKRMAEFIESRPAYDELRDSSKSFGIVLDEQAPPVRPVMPTPDMYSDKMPSPTTDEEVQKLLPGTRWLAPDGTIRVR